MHDRRLHDKTDETRLRSIRAEGQATRRPSHQERRRKTDRRDTPALRGSVRGKVWAALKILFVVGALLLAGHWDFQDAQMQDRAQADHRGR